MNRLFLLLLAVPGLAEWHDYFSTVAGCAATLTGLLFVGVSISLKIILAYPQLPNRALESWALLVTILLLAGFCLVPGQPLAVLGAEVLGLGLLSWGGATWLALSQRRLTPLEHHRAHWFNVAFTQVSTLPYLVAGSSLLLGRSSGLYWVMGAMMASFFKASLDAWILLVEVNR
ncbi:MAG: hypothetical protein ACRYFK_21065 [Janthinobacterium lividum]